MGQGVVVAIYICPTASGPMLSVRESHAVPGKGLEGDRYFKGMGFYSGRPGPGGLPPAREVTLIESEVIEALKRDYGIELELGESRRNIVTRNVSLNNLMGKDFRVGEVTLYGIRLCEPCTHLEQLTNKKLIRPLVHRGGLRAQILTEGTIRVGDTIEGR